MICAQCRTDNAEHRRFCRSCGASTACVCTACAFVNAAGDRFCGGCGGALGEATTKPAQMPLAARPAPATAGAVPTLSAADLSALMQRPVKNTDSVALPAKVSQDDLDALFGGGQ